MSPRRSDSTAPAKRSQAFVRAARRRGVRGRIARLLEPQARTLFPESPELVLTDRLAFEQAAALATLGDAGNLELSYRRVDALANALERLGLGREGDVPDPFRRVWIENLAGARKPGVVMRRGETEIAIFCPPDRDDFWSAGAIMRVSYRSFDSAADYELKLADAVRLPDSMVLHLTRPQATGSIGRDDRRMPVKLEATLRSEATPEHPEWGPWCPGEVHDVSQGGFRAASRVRYDVGCELDVELLLSGQEENPLQVRAEVRWVREDRIGGHMHGLLLMERSTVDDARFHAFVSEVSRSDFDGDAVPAAIPLPSPRVAEPEPDAAEFAEGLEPAAFETPAPEMPEPELFEPEEPEPIEPRSMEARSLEARPTELGPMEPEGLRKPFAPEPFEPVERPEQPEPLEQLEPEAGAPELEGPEALLHERGTSEFDSPPPDSPSMDLDTTEHEPSEGAGGDALELWSSEGSETVQAAPAEGFDDPAAFGSPAEPFDDPAFDPPTLGTPALDEPPFGESALDEPPYDDRTPDELELASLDPLDESALASDNELQLDELPTLDSPPPGEPGFDEHAFGPELPPDLEAPAHAFEDTPGEQPDATPQEDLTMHDPMPHEAHAPEPFSSPLADAESASAAARTPEADDLVRQRDAAIAGLSQVSAELERTGRELSDVLQASANERHRALEEQRRLEAEAADAEQRGSELSGLVADLEQELERVERAKGEALAELQGQVERRSGELRREHDREVAKLIERAATLETRLVGLEENHAAELSALASEHVERTERIEERLRAQLALRRRLLSGFRQAREEAESIARQLEQREAAERVEREALQGRFEEQRARVAELEAERAEQEAASKRDAERIARQDRQIEELKLELLHRTRWQRKFGRMMGRFTDPGA